MASNIHIYTHFQGKTFSSESEIECFWNKKWNGFGQLNPRFSFWLKINFRKTASNKQVDLRKIENFVVRSKCYPEDISKVKEKDLISENLVRALKSLMDI